MTCSLNKLTTYSVGRVIQEDHRVVAEITNAPAEKCPDKIYTKKEMTIKVVEGMAPSWTFDAKLNHAVIIVPRAEYVEDARHHTNLGAIFLWVLAAAAVVGLAYWLFSWLIAEEERPVTGPKSGPGSIGRTNAAFDAVSEKIDRDAFKKKMDVTPPRQATVDAYVKGFSRPSSAPPPAQAPHPAPAAQPATTVVVQNTHSGLGDLATGMVLGEMLSGGRSSHTERIVEREVIREEPRRESRSADSESDSRSDSSSSSDSDDSSSSSSDSSYSSDSSSDSYDSSSSSDSYDSSSSSDSYDSSSSSDSGGCDSSSD